MAIPDMAEREWLALHWHLLIAYCLLSLLGSQYPTQTNNILKKIPKAFFKYFRDHSENYGVCKFYLTWGGLKPITIREASVGR